MKKYEIGFIGAGNMASAIIKGIENNYTTPSIMVSAPCKEHLDKLKSNVVVTTEDNKEIVKNCKYIVFAIKPNVSKEVFAEIAQLVDENTIFISVMAGVKIQTIKNSLPKAKAIIRVMPNLAAKVKQSLSALAFYNADEQTKQYAITIFEAIGKAIVVDEDQMDAVTAVSGSGIAYVYYMIDSMIQSSIKLGFDESSAKEIILQTFLGAISVISQDKQTPIEDMINAVCSKGGTTIEAITSFKTDKLEEIIDRAVVAAYNKSQFLSKG